MAKLNQARRDQIARMRGRGMSYAEIGENLNPPASKQLVHNTMKKIVDLRRKVAYKENASRN